MMGFMICDKLISFLGCHLINKTGKRVERSKMLKSIFDGVRIENDIDSLFISDVFIVMGDTNYRI